MSPTRRDYLKATAATAAALASPQLRVDAASQISAPAADPFVLELANEALTAARSAGASYADVLTEAGQMMPALRIRDFNFASSSDAV